MTTEDPIIFVSNRSHTAEERGKIDRSGVTGKDRSSENTLDSPPFTHGRDLYHSSNKSLGLYLARDFIDASKPVEDWAQACSGQSIVELVEQEQADVILSVNSKKETVFTLTNKDSVKYGLQTLPTPCYSSISPTIQSILPILNSMSRWRYYMRLIPNSRPFKDGIDLEFYSLKQTGEYDDYGNPILKPDSPNLHVNGVVTCVANDEHFYGCRFVNRTSQDLYAYVFDFSATSLTINELSSRISGFYQPDPTLRKNAAITIGYESEDPLPFMFQIDEGMDTDVDVLKLFVSTEPSRLSNAGAR
ncbi:hypothetical protein OPQ81_011237 [Rhizoctonia solani]|nr:hypothetical protein OPQ81_011237 [Rhizoctonia solani]